MMKIDLTNVQRSRLKVTMSMCIVLMAFSCFPMYIIVKAANIGIFGLVAAWSAWGTSVGAIATLAGYYVNKDTQRPSNVMNTYVGHDHEDEDDPEDIPL